MDTGHEWLDIPAAALRLGISEDALRKRIQRQQITARKDGPRWRVLVGDDGTAPKDIGQDRSNPDTNKATTGQDSAQAVNLELVSTLQSQLAEKDRQIAELHALLGNLQQTVTRLLGPGDGGPHIQAETTPVEPSDPSNRTAEGGIPPRSTNVAPGGAQRESEPSWRVRLRRFMGWE